MEIKIVGLRPGEKLYEELLMDKESAGMIRTAHNKIFVAPPIVLDEREFEAQLGQLDSAIQADDAQAIVDGLIDIVQTYKPNRDMLAG